jgi:hypothetical protein
MTTNYPTGYDTLTSGSLGTGKKKNKEPIIDSTYGVDAAELNTHAGAIRALQTTLGDGSSVLPRDGDADEGNVRYVMDFLADRADKAGFNEHFITDSTSLAVISIHVDDFGAVAARANVTGGIGVSAQTLPGGGGNTGLVATDEHFHQRSSYFRCRWQVDALPATVADPIYLGIYRNGTHYVRFYSECNNAVGPVWDAWTVEINDGGSTDSDTLTATPVAAAWHLFEILTTSAGAYFYYDRGTSSEEYVYLNGQAPEDGYADPIILASSNVGGEVLRVDSIACRDTRTL